MPNSTIGNVVALWRYPVSSLSGESLERARLTATGIEFDRLFAIVDEETREPINPAKKQWYGAPRLLSKLDQTNIPMLSLDGNEWHRFDTPFFEKSYHYSLIGPSAFILMALRYRRK